MIALSSLSTGGGRAISRIVSMEESSGSYLKVDIASSGVPVKSSESLVDVEVSESI